jgi:hypothetical protein
VRRPVARRAERDERVVDGDGEAQHVGGGDDRDEHDETDASGP